MRKKFSTVLMGGLLIAALTVPASALEYSVEAPDGGLFGTPTSDDTVYVSVGEATNTDRSKNAAYIPPEFGSPTSYLPDSGERLTPNLVIGGTGTVITGELP